MLQSIPMEFTKTQKCIWEKAKQAVILLSRISQSKYFSTIFFKKNMLTQLLLKLWQKKSLEKAMWKQDHEVPEKLVKGGTLSICSHPTNWPSLSPKLALQEVDNWLAKPLQGPHSWKTVLLCFYIIMWYKRLVISFTTLVSVILHVLCDCLTPVSAAKP